MKSLYLIKMLFDEKYSFLFIDNMSHQGVPGQCSVREIKLKKCIFSPGYQLLSSSLALFLSFSTCIEKQTVSAILEW